MPLLRQQSDAHHPVWRCQRVMESISRFITQKLKLKVNEAKLRAYRLAQGLPLAGLASANICCVATLPTDERRGEPPGELGTTETKVICRSCFGNRCSVATATSGSMDYRDRLR